MASTLEHKAKATINIALLHGNRTDILGALEAMKSVPEGLESTDGPFKNEQTRTLFALLILQDVFAVGGKVYGGFPRDILTGNNWTDVDLWWEDKNIMNTFYKFLCRNLARTLCIEPYNVKIDTVASKAQHTSYALTQQMVTVCYEGIDYEISIDNTLSKARHNAMYHAITAGSMLMFDGWEFSFNDNSKYIQLNHLPPVGHVVSLLKNGQDILLCLGQDHWNLLGFGHRAAYIQYIKQRYAKASKKCIFVSELGYKGLINPLTSDGEFPDTAASSNVY